MPDLIRDLGQAVMVLKKVNQIPPQGALANQLDAKLDLVPP
jgi:hypothetical protein